MPGVELVNDVAATDSLLQTAKLAGTVTVGTGLTVMVYVAAVPAHPLAVGVTVITPVIGAVVVLVAVNEGTLPVPPAPSPIAVLLLVHVKVVPGVGLVNVVDVTPALWHTWKLAGTVTTGMGLTVITYDDAGPVHPLALAVTVIVAVIGDDVVFAAVNAGTLPVPFAGRPIAVLLLVHVMLAPAGTVVKLVAATASFLQTEKFDGTVTVGEGLTVMV